MTNIAIENDHLKWIFLLKMVIFHSYVSLPEGTSKIQIKWDDGSRGSPISKHEQMVLKNPAAAAFPVESATSS